MNLINIRRPNVYIRGPTGFPIRKCSWNWFPVPAFTLTKLSSPNQTKYASDIYIIRDLKYLPTNLDVLSKKKTLKFLQLFFTFETRFLSTQVKEFLLF